MRVLWWMALSYCAASVTVAQGIRGVTRRTPTVIHGQTASQFFAAGGVPLNPVNPALAIVPGASQNGAPANRGVASMPVPMVRSGVPPTTPLSHRAAATVYPAATLQSRALRR